MTKTKTSSNGSATPPIAAITLQRIERETISVRLNGTAPLIVHRFDEKSKQMMLEAQQSTTRAKKQPKDPVAQFEASRYLLPDGRHGFPSIAFKLAAVAGARLFEGVSMVQAKSLISTTGEGPDQLVPLIIDGEPIMREDTVRVGMGTADLRYRAQYWPWAVDLLISFAPSQISAESVIALIDAGGGAAGVGEWRPEKGGNNGTFQVAE